MITRRNLLKNGMTTLAGAICVPFINRGSYKLFAQSNIEYSERAIRLVKESLVIDMLNQFKSGGLKTPAAEQARWLLKPGSFTEADAKKYLDSGINVFARGAGASNYESGLEYFAKWNGFIAGYSQWIMRIDSTTSLEKIKSSGTIGILHSLQSSEQFRTPDDVERFYGLGLRVAQLTYSYSNMLGDGFMEAQDGGLTFFGASIVERMNKTGMGIDVSHCGDFTTLHAIETSKQPVLITHAGCRALVPKSARGKTDEMIKKMAAKGGVMGIPHIRFMIHGEEPVTMEHLSNHYDYVSKLVGVEHVGIGSDQDLETDDYYLEDSKAMAASFAAKDKLNRYQMHFSKEGFIGIEGVNHPKRVYDITEGLIRRKYSDANIKLILGGNFKRALSTIWSASNNAVN